MSLSNILKLSQTGWVIACIRFPYNEESESCLSCMRHPFCPLSMTLPNIIRIFQTIQKLQSAQNFSLEICSGERTRKRTEQELSFLHATFLLDLIYAPNIYYQFTSNSMGVMASTRFLLQGIKLHNKESESCLSCIQYTPTGPPLNPYQILSKIISHSMGLWPAQDFGFRADNHITKKVSFLTCI